METKLLETQGVFFKQSPSLSNSQTISEVIKTENDFNLFESSQTSIAVSPSRISQTAGDLKEVIFMIQRIPSHISSYSLSSILNKEHLYLDLFETHRIRSAYPTTKIIDDSFNYKCTHVLKMKNPNYYKLSFNHFDLSFQYWANPSSFAAASSAMECAFQLKREESMGDAREMIEEEVKNYSHLNDQSENQSAINSAQAEILNRLNKRRLQQQMNETRKKTQNGTIVFVFQRCPSTGCYSLTEQYLDGGILSLISCDESSFAQEMVRIDRDKVSVDLMTQYFNSKIQESLRNYIDQAQSYFSQLVCSRKIGENLDFSETISFYSNSSYAQPSESNHQLFPPQVIVFEQVYTAQIPTQKFFPIQPNTIALRAPPKRKNGRIQKFKQNSSPSTYLRQSEEFVKKFYPNQQKWRRRGKNTKREAGWLPTTEESYSNGDSL